MTAPIQVWGAPEGWDAFLLAQRRREFAGPILHVARDDARMARLAEALAFILPEAEILRFPAWDCLPYDRVSPNAALVSERVATLTRLLEPAGAPRIVLTTVNALVQRVPPRAAFAGSSLDLKVNGTIQPEQLAQFLEANGYGRAGTVMEPGEYAMRGGIIDLFPAGEPDPVRLDLFGDTIESIRVFDPSSQRSGDRRQRLTLRPVSEVPLGREAIARFRSAWRDLFGQPAADDPIYHSISDGRRHPGMEHWVSLFHPAMDTLLDYLPKASVSLDHQADEVLTARMEMIADHYAARRGPTRDGEVPYRPLPPIACTWTVPTGTRCSPAARCWRSAPLASRRMQPVSMAAADPARSSPQGAWRPAAGPVSLATLPGQSTCSTSCAPRRNAGPTKAAALCSPPGPAVPASASPTC